MPYSPNRTKVHFFFENVSLVLKNRKKLKKFIDSIFKNEAKQISSINFIFCTDQALLKINRKYLHHDFYTDVISFNLSDFPAEIIGEVYISLDRVKENAKTFNISYQKELYRVIFHGALHLCGYRDKIISQKKIMERKENSYLNFYFSGFT
jgi:probable rRNA maturation factor